MLLVINGVHVINLALARGLSVWQFVRIPCFEFTALSTSLTPSLPIIIKWSAFEVALSKAAQLGNMLESPFLSGVPSLKSSGLSSPPHCLLAGLWHIE